MSRKQSIPPPVVFGAVVALLAGELASGTSLYFAFMAAISVLFACLTYNLLRGLGTISGIAFARFALSTLVISQVGKAIVLEKADGNLDAPRITITVYAIYFFSAMIGTFLFSRLRVPLPKPVEPETPSQSRNLYVVCLIGGLIGSVGLMATGMQGEVGTTSLKHGLFLVLAYLLPFSLVLAVDERIRSTQGRHSFGWMAFWPTLIIELQGFLGASRSGFVMPLAVIFLTCYLRDFRFRRRHYAIAAAFGAGFFVFVSPYYLYARGWRNNPTFREQVQTMIQTLESTPSHWSAIKQDVASSAMANPNSVNYFDSPAAVTLNRFALIGPDSTLISACSRGYHYGIASIKMDVLSGIPRVLYKNKPEFGSATFLGQLDGQETDATETTSYSTITPISDCYGGFSWAGAILFPFFVFPAIVVIYESMFDISKPWGTVATVYLCISLTEGSMGTVLTGAMIKQPAIFIGLSWCAAWIIRMIPVSGDRAIESRRLARPATHGKGPTQHSGSMI